MLHSKQIIIVITAVQYNIMSLSIVLVIPTALTKIAVQYNTMQGRSVQYKIYL